MIFQNDPTGLDYTFFSTLIICGLCMLGPILRAIQARRLRRANMAAQQTHAMQGASMGGGIFPEQMHYPERDKNLQMWEEILLTSKDHGQKLEAIARIGRLGSNDSLEMLSEYAENDRNPEILAAIEKALELLEQRQIECRIRGAIEENPEP